MGLSVAAFILIPQKWEDRAYLLATFTQQSVDRITEAICRTGRIPIRMVDSKPISQYATLIPISFL